MQSTLSLAGYSLYVQKIVLAGHADEGSKTSTARSHNAARAVLCKSYWRCVLDKCLTPDEIG